MLVYNKFAQSLLNDPGNTDEYFPVVGEAYPDTTEDFDETDGYIVLRRTNYYNTDNQLYLRTRWAVVDPVVIDSVPTITHDQINTVTIPGSGFGTQLSDMAVAVKYIPVGGLDYIPHTKIFGTITSWSATSLTVTLDLTDVIPKMKAGPGYLCVIDNNRGLEETYAITIA